MNCGDDDRLMGQCSPRLDGPDQMATAYIVEAKAAKDPVPPLLLLALS